MQPATENPATGAADGALVSASSCGTRLQHHQPVAVAGAVLGNVSMALMPQGPELPLASPPHAVAAVRMLPAFLYHQVSFCTGGAGQ